MRTFRYALLAALAFATAPAFAAPMTYTLDPNHTQVSFCWNHFGFSNPCANFNTIQGTLVYDAADPAKSSVTVTLPLSGLDTHVPALDEHLKLPDFFDAARYPDVSFKSTKVTPGARPDELTVDGELTAHGVTRPVVLAVHLNKIGEQPMLKAPAIGFNATTTIQRSAFGVGAYVPMVSDAVHVRITVEADEASAFAKAMAAMAGKK